MATSRPGTARRESVGTALLEQLAELEARSMSPETARKILDLKFEATHQQRVHALSEKARAGTLSTPERHELDEYIRVADLLALLQSRARQALKDADSPS